jgi:hypothetical protein
VANTAELELQQIEDDYRLQLAALSANVQAAKADLLSTTSLRDKVVKIATWIADYPNATRQLLHVVAADADASARLASAVIATASVDGGDLDQILVAAFPQLRGALRDAAADRPSVRQLLGLRDGEGYQAVPEPPSEWLWPVGEPFPSEDTTLGQKARLNHIGLGAGPLTDEWTNATTAAVQRFQVLEGTEPTGALDDRTLGRLTRATGSAPKTLRKRLPYHER